MDFRILFLLTVIAPITIGEAFADPGDLCFEDIDDLCGLKSGDPAQVFGAVLTPLESQLAGFSVGIFLGGLLGIVWFKTENIMLVAIVGVFIAATATGISEDILGIGWMLIAVAMGFLLFQMIRQRVTLFS